MLRHWTWKGSAGGCWDEGEARGGLSAYVSPDYDLGAKGNEGSCAAFVVAEAWNCLG
jgi:hypothetical protein